MKSVLHIPVPMYELEEKEDASARIVSFSTFCKLQLNHPERSRKHFKKIT